MTLAILCPGQGEQHPGMLALIAGNPTAEKIFAEGARALGTDVREALSAPDQIHVNAIAQPLLCLTELATWAALREAVPTPMAFAGYSVGELASYACAGAMSAAQLAILAATRANLMDAANAANSAPSGLLAVRGLHRAEIDVLCKVENNHHAAWVAIVNANDAFIIGGEDSTLNALADRARLRGAQITRLKVSVASHTPLLAAAVQPFRAALERAEFLTPNSPVTAGISASFVTSRSNAIVTLSEQLAGPILWSQCLESLYERGCRVYLELGPGRALARMAQAHLGDSIEARSVDEFRSLDGVAKWVGQYCAVS